jgi:hypothetical protein
VTSAVLSVASSPQARLAEAEAGHMGHEGVEEMQDEIRDEYESKMEEIKEKEAQSGEKYKKIQAMFLKSVVNTLTPTKASHHHIEVDSEGKSLLIRARKYATKFMVYDMLTSTII